ncbi:AraC family transcriptional regulator (plasmid) [Spirosoma sp. SC4-14]|uniref:AraC family transcriptional regulator n=1 Tax=Spirosoma sp. SC4-14 TaxID=3128900 RepID=UPI0030D57EBF
MKPQLLRVPIISEQSFSVRRDVVLHFYNRWHYHPEIELVHIEHGSGTQFVGDSIQHFQPGDVLLVGANLPHYWRCDQEYFENREGLLAQATVVHFRADFWGDTFLQLPENRPVVRLLERARQGIRLLGSTREQIKNRMAQLLTEQGTARLVSLIQILSLLAEAPDLPLLSAQNYPIHFDEADTDRINLIYAYSLAHFQRKISLNEIAAVAAMSPNSFCRYFKSRSRKSFSQFLLELRVQHACKLLIEGRLSIAMVCNESGFNQFSGFNKYFKLITGKSPMQYQRTFAK